MDKTGIQKYDTYRLGCEQIAVLLEGGVNSGTRNINTLHLKILVSSVSSLLPLLKQYLTKC